MNRQELSTLLREYRKQNGVLIKRICTQMDAGANIINRIERAMYNYNCNTWFSYMNAIGVIAEVSHNNNVIPLDSIDRMVEMFKSIRISNGITQRELAKIIGISHVNIANIERGHTKLTIDVFLAIINAFGYELKILNRATNSDKMKNTKD